MFGKGREGLAYLKSSTCVEKVWRGKVYGLHFLAQSFPLHLTATPCDGLPESCLQGHPVSSVWSPSPDPPTDVLTAS